MDAFDNLLAGFAAALQPIYLLYALLGVLLGTAVGVLPGIGPAMTVALLLPVTASMNISGELDPTAAMIIFAGIYYGGMYGGSTTSILLSTPGESASIITALEGNRMARAGRGAAALATAAIGSFIAGTIGTVLLGLLAPLVSQLARNLQPWDYFALLVVAFLTVGALMAESFWRGMASLALGLFVGTIGLAAGQDRFTLGRPELVEGVNVVLVAVGLFALGEALYVGARLRQGAIPLIPVTRGWRTWMRRSDWARSWKPWLRGSFIGFPIGTIPAGGADVATFLSYATEKSLAKPEYKKQFGKGAIEGVAGPEAANNAAAAGVLVPLLTLGIPTTATAAIMITALQSFNLDPGPRLLENEQGGPLVWALIASLYIGNVMLLVLNLPLVGIWVKLLQIPRPYLYAGILVFAALGAFATNFDVFDVGVILVLGVLGFFMRRQGFPIAPLVVGAILGPLAEKRFADSLQISLNDPSVLVSTPFSVIVYVSLALLFVGAFVVRRRKARVQAESPAVDTVAISALDEEIEMREPHPELDRGRLTTQATPSQSAGGDAADSDRPPHW